MRGKVQKEGQSTLKFKMKSHRLPNEESGKKGTSEPEVRMSLDLWWTGAGRIKRSLRVFQSLCSRETCLSKKVDRERVQVERRAQNRNKKVTWMERSTVAYLIWQTIWLKCSKCAFFGAHPFWWPSMISNCQHTLKIVTIKKFALPWRCTRWGSSYLVSQVRERRASRFGNGNMPKKRAASISEVKRR